jgi:hypothetical protein
MRDAAFQMLIASFFPRVFLAPELESALPRTLTGLVVVALLVLSCTRGEPPPDVRESPATPRVETTGNRDCDTTPVDAEARRVARCTDDGDCMLTTFGDCWLGGQQCGALPHHRDADLTGYRAARTRYHARCPERTACRCARPNAAACRNRMCVALR